MHAKKIGWVYLRELFGSLAIYTVMLVASIKFGRPIADGALRTVILLSPMVGFFLAVWSIGRHLVRIDEYLRQFTLENIAIAAAATAGLSFSYGFLETAGYPRLTMFSVWGVLCSTFMLASFVRAWMNRE